LTAVASAYVLERVIERELALRVAVSLVRD